MSDEAPLTDQQLLQATSRTLAPNAAVDAETAALRDGFLRLGSAIEAAGSEFDAAQLLARLQLADTGGVSPALPARPRFKWLTLVLAGALAASALVVIVRSVALWSPPQVVKAPDEDKAPQPDIAANGAIDGSPLAGWSDPLDDEIASAQDAVERIHRRPGDLDGALDSFGSRLEALAAELESGSL